MNYYYGKITFFFLKNQFFFEKSIFFLKKWASKTSWWILTLVDLLSGCPFYLIERENNLIFWLQYLDNDLKATLQGLNQHKIMTRNGLPNYFITWLWFCADLSIEKGYWGHFLSMAFQKFIQKPTYSFLPWSKTLFAIFRLFICVFLCCVGGRRWPARPYLTQQPPQKVKRWKDAKCE